MCLPTYQCSTLLLIRETGKGGGADSDVNGKRRQPSSDPTGRFCSANGTFSVRDHCKWNLNLGDV